MCSQLGIAVKEARQQRTEARQSPQVRPRTLRATLADLDKVATISSACSPSVCFNQQQDKRAGMLKCCNARAQRAQRAP